MFVTENDFAEYNAKPYTRLTVSSLLNLYDFSCEAGYRTVTAPTFPEKCSGDDRKLIDGVALVLVEVPADHPLRVDVRPPG